GMAGAGEPGVRDDSSAALRWRARREAAGSKRHSDIDAGCRGVDCGVHGSAGARCAARTGFDCDCDCELFLYGFLQARYAVDYFGLGCCGAGGWFGVLMALQGVRSVSLAARAGFDCDCDCELFLYGFFKRDTLWIILGSAVVGLIVFDGHSRWPLGLKK